MANSVSIVVLVSGNGSNLQAIIDAIATGQISAKIRAVISNVPDVYALERAQSARIPTDVVNHKDYDSREDFDRSLKRAIENYSPDLIVLAGFMRMLSDDFVNYYQGRMLNIHPSLLPKFRGLNTHQRALDDGEQEHGASVHFVTPELDSGPVIIQAVVPVQEDDDSETLMKRVFKEEHVIYPLAISWFASGRVQLENGKVMFDDKELQSPIVHKGGETILPTSPEA